jgi:type VI secretion system protein ImpF
MSVASSLERIQPCLFEKLIDFAPEQQKESRSERVLSVARYRDAVIRDLGWLLNSSGHLDKEGLDEFPHVENSVFNFGKRDLAGIVASSIKPTTLEEEIADAIRRYEPRIVPESLKVKCVATEGIRNDRKVKGYSNYNCLIFEITGELWAQPVSEEFYLKTTLDLETGAQAL